MAEEDTPYSVGKHATSEEDDSSNDPDQANKSILVELKKEMKSDIKHHNSFNVLDLPQNATDEQKIAVFNEIAIHKGLVLYLKMYESKISDKVKELK